MDDKFKSNQGANHKMKKAVLLACLLGGMALASTKSFHVTFYQPTMIAGTELQAGNYKMELQDQNQKLVIKHGKETTEASVKVESNDRKFDSTSIRYDTEAGKYRLQEIRLGGTNMKIVLD
jgi:hypothetical protein